MSHLHQRGAEELKGVGLPHMLDCIPLDMYQKVVDKSGLDRVSAKRARRSAASEAVAMPRLQLTQRRSTQKLHMLVRERGRPQIFDRNSTSFMWSDLRKGESEKMSAPMSAYLPCWTMSALHTHGADPNMLLR